MQVGMIGLGRMGANMVRRLMRGGHSCVVYDRDADAVQGLVGEGAIGATSPAELLKRLERPAAIFVMVPAAVVDTVIADLESHLHSGDTVIDGGNSHYADDVARHRRLAERGAHYVDMGTSGGVWGLERGYCLMIGGDAPVVARLEPVFRTLAPGRGALAATRGRESHHSTADEGWLHCGPSGAGHFVKMVHNGIEYGLMAAYAEGFNLLAKAGAGSVQRSADAETAPLRDAAGYTYDLDLADVAELWRRGSVITSWLLDLTAEALTRDPKLERFSGPVSDSGEGRWTVNAAVDLGVPAHAITAALFARFASRDLDDFQNRVLSAMRHGFGGHGGKP